MATALQNLIDSGIPKKMAERLILQATAEATPKKVKAARRFFPGMASKTTKVDIDVEVLIVCECCGGVEKQMKTIKASPDSPTKMKTAVSVCNSCPDFLRQYTQEELIAVIIAGQHSGIAQKHRMLRSQLRIALQHTPEEIVNLRLQTF